MLAAPRYRPRRTGPEHDPLYRVLDEHLEEFLAEERSRPLPWFVEEELRAYLTCGRPERGFTWWSCASCDHAKVVPFSCKGRGFCPSCAGRRMNQLAANLVDRVLPVVPIRQWVASFPMRVRFRLANRPKLRNQVMAAVVEVVHAWYRERVSRPEDARVQGGAVAVWHLVGGSLNANPHLHVLFLDGAYASTTPDGEPVFRCAQAPTQRAMGVLVSRLRRAVEEVLEEAGLAEHVDTDDADGQAELQWESVQGRGSRRERGRMPPERSRGGLWGWDEHYDLHAGRPVPGADRERLERLARYVARGPLSLKRLSVQEDGRVRLALRTAYHDGTRAFVFTPRAFIGRLVACIAHPRHNLIHYFGVLAPRARWRRLVVPDAGPPRGPGTPGRSSWIPWAQLVLRVFGVDPTTCPRCGGQLVVRAIVRTPSVAVGMLHGFLGALLAVDVAEVGGLDIRGSPAA